MQIMTYLVSSGFTRDQPAYMSSIRNLLQNVHAVLSYYLFH